MRAELLCSILAATLAAGSLDAQSAVFEIVPPETSAIRWVHDSGRSDDRHLPESLGPGVAFLDFDGDGDMDLFLVNSGPSDFYRPAAAPRHALCRNEGGGRFVDVAAEAGVAGADSFGMGAAVADYDNDGRPDLLVTAYGPLRLFHNEGGGKFREVSREAGVAFEGWTTSAAFFDFDNDGDLDLFICGFVRYGPAMSGLCGTNKFGKKFYCIPRVFEPTRSLLFRNLGDGRFERADAGSEIATTPAKALGVVAADIDGDRRLDLFVASDTAPNALFMNRGRNRWEDIALFAEVAYSADGRSRSGMGVDAGDIDGDGRPELFVANVDGELFSLYRNNGDETFTDVARPHGVAEATRTLSGWGLRFFDYDNDGDLDLLLANGHPDDMIEQHRAAVAYREPLVLFRNDDGLLRDVSRESGPAFAERYPARGLATGDFDNDGRVDVLIGNNGEAPVLLRNRAGGERGWVGVRLEGRRANRDAVGARLRWSAGGRTYERYLWAGGSYLSAHDPRTVLGLGAAQNADWVEVAWPAPSQRVERFHGLAPGRYHTLVEGQGRAAE